MKTPKRSLVLCDVENLSEVPPPLGTQTDYEDALWMLADLVQVQPTDHVVVASHPNPRGAFAARAVFPGCLLKVGHGPDGADNMLLSQLQDPDWIAGRYERVVIGSGDGAFTPAVAALEDRGISTVVVSHKDRCSRQLSATTRRVLHCPARVTTEP